MVRVLKSIHEEDVTAFWEIGAQGKMRFCGFIFDSRSLVVVRRVDGKV